MRAEATIAARQVNTREAEQNLRPRWPGRHKTVACSRGLRCSTSPQARTATRPAAAPADPRAAKTREHVQHRR